MAEPVERKLVAVRMPVDVEASIVECAAAHGVTKSAMLVMMATEYLERHGWRKVLPDVPPSGEER